MHRRDFPARTVTDEGFATGNVISSPLSRCGSETIMKKARPQWLTAE